MTILLDFIHRKKIKVLLVCTANICRSPMAHALLRGLVESCGLTDKLYVESAGTHVPINGLLPDKRTIATLKKHDVSVKKLKTRQFKANDIDFFDYILVMDNKNLDSLNKRFGENNPKIQLLMEYSKNNQTMDVADPYYGHPSEFKDLFVTLEAACKQLLNAVVNEHRLHK